MTKKQGIIITLLSLGCLVLALLISQRLSFRLDLTGNYAIAPATRNLYAEIDGQVRITYFLSDRLAAIHPMPNEIKDLLREYAAYSRGRISLTVRDPLKANMIADVERLGIPGQQIETVEEDEASVATVYTGILIEYLDRSEVLPSVFSLDTLEYDLTSRIRGLIHNTNRELGILLGDSGRLWERDYRYLNQALLQAGYSLRQVAPGEEVAAPLQALLVLGGADELDESALLPIDRYIAEGGKVLFALDAIGVDIGQGFSPRPYLDKGLLGMVASYGAAVTQSLALDASALTLPYQTSNGPARIRLVRYPHWIATLAEFSNQDHPVSAGFGGADLYWASPLELNPPEGVEAIPLFTATSQGWTQSGEFYLDPEDPRLYERSTDAETELILGASLSGVFPPYFAENETPQGGKSSRIILVGDADFATDLLEYTGSQRNLEFLLRAADWLSNDEDIIAIRRRSAAFNRLDRIPDQAARRRAMLFARTLNVIVVPLGIIVLGVLICVRRRGAKK